MYTKCSEPEFIRGTILFTLLMALYDPDEISGRRQSIKMQIFKAIKQETSVVTFVGGYAELSG